MTPRRLLALAWRESRFARRRLLLFLSAISLGVAALVAVQGFSANLQAGVRDQARALLGADVSLSARQPFSEEVEALLDSLTAAGVRSARVTSFASMALLPRTRATRLVQVRAPEAGFPFYGEIETQPAGRWEALASGRNAVVDPALMLALDARLGDSISLGEASFEIVAALESVPGDIEIASAFAPRVYIPARYLAATELLGFGSRVEYEAYLQLPAAGAAQHFTEAYEDLLGAEEVRVRTADEQRESLERAMGRLGSYLGLVATFALLLGGIGVASAMGAYMAQKQETIAVLRCLGATSRQVLVIYLTQAAAMGLAGAVVGAGLGASVQWLLPQLLQGFLPVEVPIGLDGATILAGIAIGLWIALAFAIIPLLNSRHVSPLGALRRQPATAQEEGVDGYRASAIALLVFSVVLLLMIQADSFQVGLALAAGIFATLGVLYAAATAIMRSVRSAPKHALPYTARQGVANLHRPGNQTRIVVLALGFGVFLLANIALMQHNLLRPLRMDGASERANLVLWDVQQDQAAEVERILGASGLPVLQRAPIVPMRIAEINGQPVQAGEDEDDADDGSQTEPERWAVSREYRSTFRDSLVGSERLIEGEWWTGPTRSPYPVSLEREIADDLRVELGDTLTWNVQGVMITTVVTSIREVDWARFEPNFFAVFPSAALEAAPQTLVMLTRAPGLEARASAQRDIVSRFPNVAVLDLTRVQAALDDVIGRISTVIRFLALFSIATGFVVLLGAIATSRIQRVRESVLLKAIGATRRQIGAIMATEYLLLGTLSAIIGSGLALLAGWALARWLFEVDFGIPLGSLSLLLALTGALALGVGLWASREVFASTPLEAIREE
ncbi:MAG TPA: FtsX-like permease family protein [Longimicrobiaceae bacterium]|nr:FtsX-like permease family protein [Longimicrobiaceae bacterium]